MTKFNNLVTDEYSALDKYNPLKEYPFPHLKRLNFISLNGSWRYKIGRNQNDITSISEEIIVPFAIESLASGVQKRIKKGEYIFYKKTFKVSEHFLKKHTFITFLGVDQSFKVILNDSDLGEYIPLNMPTKIDISDFIKEKNELIVICKDDLSSLYPLGKQSKKPKGIFYTPFSGIYYPVIIESFDEDYIKDVKIKTTLDTVNIDIDSSSDYFEIIIKEKNKIIIKEITSQKNLSYKIANPILWDTNNPFLYDIEIKTKKDRITSYFALREITLKDGFFYLNNKKIFVNGVLDQGYYPEGIITPITYASYEKDILAMKELGFNTLRKHIKVELPYFYYLCDKLGMLVLQDFVNNGKYNFFTDTALPTIGKQVKNDKNANKNIIQRDNFIKCGEKLIEYLSHFPSIIGYTIFNEGWGQFDSEATYKHFKSLYPNLIFDTASGWYRGASSDIESFHWYFKNIDKIKDATHPIFISEFGALCYKQKNHCYGNRHVFGYKYFNSIEEVENAFISLYEEKIIPYKDKLIGTIYTQLSDVEEEDNGLLTYDRKILKLSKEKVQNVLKKLQ